MKIDLHKIIKHRNLDRKALSRVLFPKHRHPEMALTRHLSRRNSLTEEQVYRLAIFSEMPIESLYSDFAFWKMEQHHDLVRFSRDNFTALLSPKTGITKLYHRDKLFTTITLSRPTIPLEEYLQELNSLVNIKSTAHEQ